MTPSVTVRRSRGRVRAVVLVLHGGMEHNLDPVGRFQPAALRMVPFARAMRLPGVEVWQLRYRVRGWNDEQRSPVADAQWALEEVRRRHGALPVVLLGHSMGGRAAVNVLDDPSVVGLVALCPWLPTETADAAAGRRVVVAHAVDDTTTSPEQSLRWATSAAAVAASVSYVAVLGSGHSMLRRPRVWHRLARDAVAGMLLGAGAPGLTRSTV